LVFYYSAQRRGKADVITHKGDVWEIAVDGPRGVIYFGGEEMSKSGVAVRTALILLFTFAANSSGKYSGGLGTTAEPFRISAVPDWQELMATPADWAAYFILTSDIDLNGVSITPIAPDTSTSSGFQGTPFTGVFDGNDYVIRNADVNMLDSDYVGLFGYLGTDGQIRNLGVEDASIFGRYRVGGLVGFNVRGVISNCYSTGSVSGADRVGGLVGENYDSTIRNSYSTGSVSGADHVGGLVGYNNDDLIRNCYSICSVSGAGYVGGLVGRNRAGTVSACYSTGWVSGDAYYVGGLVGHDYDGLIRDCYSSGSVIGHDDYVGGLVGYSERTTTRNCYSIGSVTGFFMYVGGLVGYKEDGAISNCYSTGSVSGTDSYLGGLVGRNHGSIASSFWDVNTSGWPTSAGGTPKTTAEMKTQSTFTSAVWDFIGETANGTEDIWSICEGTNYPRFVWQIPAADWICPDGVGLEDFSYLGGVWGSADPDPANLDGEDGIGFGDLKVFCEEWLSGR
jgi:hypothetical protein